MAPFDDQNFDELVSDSPFPADLSWKEVLKIDTNGKSPLEIRKAAQSKGLSYYVWGVDQVRSIEGGALAGEICYLRVYLAVPYADKETVKQLGARWNSSRRLWYAIGRGSDLDELAKWTAPEDRVLLKCPPEHVPYALARGALKDSNGALFIPSWYWLAGMSMGEKVHSLCYWLPPEHEEYRAFKNVREAAEQISLCGYIPAHSYLPEERAHLEHLCRTTKKIYFFNDTRNPESSYFRWVEWDTY